MKLWSKTLAATATITNYMILLNIHMYSYFMNRKYKLIMYTYNYSNTTDVNILFSNMVNRLFSLWYIYIYINEIIVLKESNIYIFVTFSTIILFIFIFKINSIFLETKTYT